MLDCFRNIPHEKGRINIDIIIFLGTQKSGSSREALQAAENLGYFTCLFTKNYKQISDRHSYPEVHIMQYCALDNIDAVRETIRYLQHSALKIRAIVSFIDPYCALAARLAEEFGVGCFSYEAMEIMQNKHKTRELLKDSPYNPRFTVITKENYEESERTVKRLLPAVIKYIDSNGSRDVYYCDRYSDYLKNSERLFNQYGDGTLILEEYLDGEQFIVEVLVIAGKVNIVAVVEQEIEYINEHFIITGYNLLTNYSRSYFEKLKKSTEEIVKLYGLENGPCHLEMRLVKGNWKLVEINPRISGAGMNRFLDIGFGINLVQETLKLALGKEVNLERKHNKNTFAQHVILERSGILKKITGKREVLASPGVKYVYVKPRKGSYLSPPSSLGNRYAFVIATGGTEKEARWNAKSAAEKIVFHLISE
ncbi:MAG: ATP-grasp domain-containing protein [Bacilli bacterium]